MRSTVYFGFCSIALLSLIVGCNRDYHGGVCDIEAEPEVEAEEHDVSRDVKGVRVDSKVISELIAKLSSNEREIRIKAAEDIIAIGESAIMHLVSNLGVRNRIAQDLTSRCIAHIGEPAIAHVLKERKNKNPDMRYGVVMTLNRIGSRKTLPIIREMIFDDDKFVRMEAASALGKMNDINGVSLLIDILEDENNIYLRKSAIISLGEIGDKKAVEPLIRCLNDRECKAVQEILGVFGEIGDKRAIPHIIAKLRATGVHCLVGFTAIGKIGTKAGAEYLIEELRNNKKEMYRGHAAINLARTGQLIAVSALISCFRDDSSPVVRKCEIAVAEFGMKAIGPLRNALSSPDWRLRGSAIASIGRIGDEKSIPYIMEMINDKNKEVRWRAKVILCHLTEQDFKYDYIAWRKWWENEKKSK
jgi:HEAT repeat protein